MKEEIRTTRPIGVTKSIPIKGHRDPTACKHEIDWNYFTYDSNRCVYIRKPSIGFKPERDSLWVYTEEFMKKWEQELSEVMFVMREELRPLLLK